VHLTPKGYRIWAEAIEPKACGTDWREEVDEAGAGGAQANIVVELRRIEVAVFLLYLVVRAAGSIRRVAYNIAVPAKGKRTHK